MERSGKPASPGLGESAFTPESLHNRRSDSPAPRGGSDGHFSTFGYLRKRIATLGRADSHPAGPLAAALFFRRNNQEEDDPGWGNLLPRRILYRGALRVRTVSRVRGF